jgi:hypothetical protein
MDFTGPADSACTSTNLAPQATFDCDLTHNITQPEREAGLATLQLAVEGKRTGAEGAAQRFAMASAEVDVWQNAALSLTVQETPSGLHTTNSEYQVYTCVSSTGCANLKDCLPLRLQLPVMLTWVQLVVPSLLPY